jgi:hypothetical protein
MYLILLLVLFIIGFIYLVWKWGDTDKQEGVPISYIVNDEAPLEEIQATSTDTSYIAPPKIMDKLDLTLDEKNQFLKDFEKFKSSNSPKGNSMELIKNIVIQMTSDVDKEALYQVMCKLTRGVRVQKTSIPPLVRMATLIITKRKPVSNPQKKNELDKRMDINKAIKDEFRNVRLSSLEAHILRKCILDFLNKTECVLSRESYKVIIKYLVRGYGVITKLQTVDNILASDDIDACQLDELKQYGFVEQNRFDQKPGFVEQNRFDQKPGFVEFDLESAKWIPTIKAKLYTALRYDVKGDFIEYPDDLAEIVCDLEKAGYISYSLDGIQLTDKCVDIKTAIDLNNLYNDVASFIKSSNTSCSDYELYTQNVFLDLKSFSKKLYGTLSKNDYNTMIVNIAKAFTML